MKPRNMIQLLALACDTNKSYEDRKFHCQELGRSILAQDWGQNGCLFITENSHWPHGSGSSRRLYVNDRLRCEVVVYDTRDGDVNVVVTPRSAEYGEAEREAQKERQKEEHEKAQKQRRLCINDLKRHGVTTPRNFGNWFYYEGQEGGCFCHRHTSAYVGAPGALRAAKDGGAVEQEERDWDRKIHGARF